MADPKSEEEAMPVDDIPIEEEVSMEEVAGITAAVFQQAKERAEGDK